MPFDNLLLERDGAVAVVTAPIPNPTAMAASPPETTRLLPNRRTSFGEIGAVIPVKTAKGTVRTPADSVL